MSTFLYAVAAVATYAWLRNSTGEGSEKTENTVMAVLLSILWPITWVMRAIDFLIGKL